MNPISSIFNLQSSIPSPYPGPRSFNEEESLYFKGRDEYLDEITKKLKKHHFLMVTGSSGDGKSSLIFAGLIPHARAGFLKAEFTNWVIADFRPKRDPLRNLSHELSDKLGIHDTDKVESKLKHGFSALVDLYKDSPLYKSEIQKSKKANLLILADQFEEFFTNEENYNPNTGVATEQAQHMVQLLLETIRVAQKENLPVYVVCTMRSDFFGNCNAFQALPEMIEQSQKFLGRLSKQHILEAISEPAKLAGIKISERLLQFLMNEITGDVGTDMLPILQHCLYQIYEVSGRGTEEMDLIHYAMVGGFPKENLPEKDQQRFEQWLKEQPVNLQNAYKNPSLRNVLDIHANRLYDTTHEYYNKVSGSDRRLSKQKAQHIIKVAFQCLTKIDENRAVRSLTSLQEIIEMLGYKKNEREKVARVLDIFRIQGNTFLRPFISKDPASKNLRLTTVLDITHEALMRNWTKLEQWAREQHERVIIYRDLCNQLHKWLKNKKPKELLLSAGALNYFERWFNSFEVNPIAWLKRYMDSKEEIEVEKKPMKTAEHYEDIKEYLRVSRANINRKKKLVKAVVGVICVLLLIASVGFFWVMKLKEDIKISAKSNEIATKAYRVLDNDPTLSFRLAEQAYNIYQGKLAKEVLMASYSKVPFYTLLKGHEKQVNRVRFTPDSKYVVSVSKDATIGVWNIKGNELRKHDVRITSWDEHEVVDISHDGKYIIAAQQDYTVSLSETLGDELILLKGHRGYVNSVYFSPDDKLLLTAAEDTTARLWGINGKELQILIGHNARIRCAKFAPDGLSILTASYDNTVRIWDLKGNEIKRLEFLNFSRRVNATFSLNGKYIVTTGADYPRLWNLESGQVTFLKGHNGGTLYADFSPDGKYIVTGSVDKTAIIWDIQGNIKHVLKGHSAWVCKAIFSPDGHTIITISSDGLAILWDLQGNRLQTLKGHNALLLDANFSPNGKLVVTSSTDNTVRIWNIYPEENPVITGHFGWLEYAGYSADGQYILTIGKNAQLRDNKGNLLHIINNSEPYNIHIADFSPDMKYILTVSSDKIARLWDLNGQYLRSYKGHKDKIWYAKFAPNGQYFITGGGEDENIVRFWDLEGGELMKLYITQHASFSNDGRYLITTAFVGVDTSFSIYEIIGNTLPQKLRLIKTVNGFSARISSVHFSLNGKYIIALIDDLSNRLWYFDKYLEELKLVKKFKGHSEQIKELTFSKDDQFFATTSADKTAIIWDMKGNAIKILKGHTDIVNDIDFSNDGQYLVTGSNDKTVRIWDMNGNELQIITGHTSLVFMVSFSPNDNYILSASNDHKALLMPVFAKNALHKINVEKVRGEVWQMTEDDKKLYGIYE
ncbi:MAG: WD40 repeat domain-containing protein [Cytophagales bacterium]|nr:WD40 repeat domain-containing protein [Cytophagales bacterium]